MVDKIVSRRSFIAQGAAAASAFAIVPRRVLGGQGNVSPSERLTHAVIGVGGMGRGHVGYVLRDKGARLVAVCDVDEQHIKRARQLADQNGQPCKGYKDFRDLLDRERIDIVHIATPPHWHALISIAAAEAGCDIWCEKPMTRTIAEGRHVVDAVQRNGRMFRLNTWFRLYSDLYGLGCTAKPLKKIVSHGLLGWPITARISPSQGFVWKVRGTMGRTDLQPEHAPPHLDYDLWLGPAQMKPYNRRRTHGTFRGYWDYEGGGLADMGQHYMDPIQYILDKDDTSPVEVEADAPWPAHPDAVGMWGRVEMRYADGCRLILESQEWGEPREMGQPYLEGPKGRVYRGPRFDPPELGEAAEALPDPEPMISDFNVSVRTRQKFGLNEVNGSRSNLLAHLANCAIRTGRRLRFDPATQRFIGDEEANRLADQPMRAPWHV
ncbi:MAG: Gfo/Idh/MocA family oxidoreductase [Planctomycetota bacterium]